MADDWQQHVRPDDIPRATAWLVRRRVQARLNRETVDRHLREGQSLYQRIGGRPAVEAVGLDLYHRIRADPILWPFFARVDLDRLIDHQVDFVSQAVDGPRQYGGRALGLAHRHRGIGGEHFERVGDHLFAALVAAGVGREDVAEIMSRVLTLRDDIVTA